MQSAHTLTQQSALSSRTWVTNVLRFFCVTVAGVLYARVDATVSRLFPVSFEAMLVSSVLCRGGGSIGTILS